MKKYEALEFHRASLMERNIKKMSGSVQLLDTISTAEINICSQREDDENQKMVLSLFDFQFTFPQD